MRRSQSRRLARVLVLLAAVLSGCTAAPLSSRPAGVCVPTAAWFEPVNRQTIAGPVLFRDLAAGGVVLVGEAHDRPEHHLWQSEVAAGLLARRADLVIGVEMLPRRAQRALDRWVAGETSEAEFLAESDWRRVWGFDFALYRPIFELARLNRLRMVALNVDRALVRDVRARG
jgi:uncharacterized iron-regulated protein